jgi:ketosteroid isomerase-like protein
MKATQPIALILSCTLISACQPEPAKHDATAFDAMAAKSIIQKKSRKFTQAHITGDLEFLNSVFAKEAKIFPPNAEVVFGAAAIAGVNSEWVSYGIKQFDEVSTGFYGNADYLVDEGSYYLVYGDDDTVDRGKYVNVWKYEDGDWKMFTNIWNTSLPLN